MKNWLALTLSFFAISIGMQSQSHAGIMFTVSQRTPGAIVQGSTAIFDVSIATIGAPPPTITVFGGATFFLGADDPTPNGGVTTGGIFTDGTNDPANALAGGKTYLFTTGEGGVSVINDSFIVFSAIGPNRNLDSTGGFLGSVLLNTTGSTIGTHSLTFSNLDAVNSNGDNLTTVLGEAITGNSLNYDIVLAAPVPEPTSIALLCMAGASAGVIRFVRKRRLSVA